MKMLSAKNLLSINLFILCSLCAFAQRDAKHDSLVLQEINRLHNNKKDSIKVEARIHSMAKKSVLIIDGILLYQQNLPFNDNKQCITKKYVLVRNVFRGDSTYKDHVLEIVTEDCDPQLFSKDIIKNNCFKNLGDTAVMFIYKMYDGLWSAHKIVSKPNLFYGYGVNYNKNKPVKAYDYELKNINQLKRFIRRSSKNK